MVKKFTKSEINKRVAEREYRVIERALRPLIRKFGEKALVRGTTKWIYKVRQRNKWLKQKRDVEKNLADLSKKLNV